jgi:hypothetical protein
MLLHLHVQIALNQVCHRYLFVDALDLELGVDGQGHAANVTGGCQATAAAEGQLILVGESGSKLICIRGASGRREREFYIQAHRR